MSESGTPKSEQAGGSSGSSAPAAGPNLANIPDEKLRSLIAKSLERTKTAETQIANAAKVEEQRKPLLLQQKQELEELKKRLAAVQEELAQRQAALQPARSSAEQRKAAAVTDARDRATAQLERKRGERKSRRETRAKRRQDREAAASAQKAAQQERRLAQRKAALEQKREKLRKDRIAELRSKSADVVRRELERCVGQCRESAHGLAATAEEVRLQAKKHDEEHTEPIEDAVGAEDDQDDDGEIEGAESDENPSDGGGGGPPSSVLEDFDEEEERRKLSSTVVDGAAGDEDDDDNNNSAAPADVDAPVDRSGLESVVAEVESLTMRAEALARELTAALTEREEREEQVKQRGAQRKAEREQKAAQRAANRAAARQEADEAAAEQLRQRNESRENELTERERNLQDLVWRAAELEKEVVGTTLNQSSSSPTSSTALEEQARQTHEAAQRATASSAQQQQQLSATQQALAQTRERAEALRQGNVPLFPTSSSSTATKSPTSPGGGPSSHLRFLEDHRNLLSRSEDECAQNAQLVRQLEIEEQRLRAELQSTQSSASDRQEAIATKRARLLAELQERKADAKKTLEELRTEMAQLEEQKESRSKEQKGLQGEMSRSTTELEAAQKGIDDLGESLRTVERQLGAAQSAIKALLEEDRVVMVDGEFGFAENVVAAVDVLEDARGKPTGARNPFETPPASTGKAGAVASSSTITPHATPQQNVVTWFHLQNPQTGKTHWVRAPEKGQDPSSSSNSVGGKTNSVISDDPPPRETVIALKQACPPVQEQFALKIADLTALDQDTRNEIERLSTETQSLSEEFVKFRQSTAHALQVNSNTRLNLSEAEKQREVLKLDRDMMERERDSEFRKRQEVLEILKNHVAEKEDRLREERARVQEVEKLKFEIDNAEFQCQKSAGKLLKGKDALIEEEKREQEVLRYREVIIPPLETEVQGLRAQLAAAEKPIDDEREGSAVGSAVNSSASDSIANKSRDDLHSSMSGTVGGVKNHNLLADRKRNLLKKLPRQAYVLQQDTAQYDLLDLRKQLEQLDSQLEQQREKIKHQYEDIVVKKQEFRQIQGIYLTPQRELEYIQHVFKKFVQTLPPDQTTKALLPVLYKFFNVQPEQSEIIGGAGGWMKPGSGANSKQPSRQNSAAIGGGDQQQSSSQQGAVPPPAPPAPPAAPPPPK